MVALTEKCKSLLLICGWVCCYRARASGNIKEDSGSAALKRLLYLTSRGESKAFGQAASNALLFGVRHASDAQAKQVCPSVPYGEWHSSASSILSRSHVATCHFSGWQ